MIRLYRSLSTAAAAALMLTATVASAEATRPGSSVPTVSKAVTETMAKRASKPAKDAEQLSGTPLLLLIFGAIAVGVAAAVIKNDSRG
ncbi:hypothetical protein [Tsuneonella sp. SYSU-LHT278]|uniref:hypothetical protein n=1 Tax=Tsuneonella sediminis TaxID=3416089 RepID=UPI003F7A518C